MTRRTLLLTGASGFVGRHLRAASEPSQAFDGWTIECAPKGLDLRNRAAVDQWVAATSAEAVIHLAAQSFVPRSFEDPGETFDINLMGTLNLLLALSRSGFDGRFLYVSSGDVYGQIPESELPVTESSVPQPRSPYAVSKLAAEQLCLQHYRSHGLQVMIARPFNHIGPGQDARFAIPSFARQIVSIADGQSTPVMDVGDIDTTRDFTDVRDIVRAYAAMLEHGVAGNLYVVGSGVERPLRQMLDTMCALEGISPVFRQDPARLRPAEQRRMAADASKLQADTGWTPIIPFESTLIDILKDARNQA